MLGEDGVRHRLIIAGLSELEEHGIRNFSLRRVAGEAGVSCAAPYRHFESKDGLIKAIVDYMREGWDLLSGQINSLYTDPGVRISEIAVAFLRFFVANGSFRTVLMAGEDNGEKSIFSSFDAPIISAVADYADSRGVKREDKDRLTFALLALVYGSLTLTITGSIPEDKVIDGIRANVAKLLA